MIKYVYVAGPMSFGNPYINVGEAVRVAERLRQAKLVPYVPQLSAFWEMIAPGAELKDWLDLDRAWVEKCDVVLRLDGPSTGADIELKHAMEHNIPIFYDVEELLDAASHQAWKSLQQEESVEVPNEVLSKEPSKELSVE